MIRRSRRILLACAAALALGGCERSRAEPPKGERLVIFAASSLRDVFSGLGEEFRRTRPGVELAFNFAGSQELRTQLEHGASADVFASADQRHMQALVRTARAVSPVVFTRNEPVVVVAKDSAARLRALSDLPAAERIVVGDAEVPIGRYTLEILDRAARVLGADFRSRVEAKVVSRELNVRQVLAKVSLGEADAGIVYATDAKSAADRVAIVAIPKEINVIAEYPIAVLASAAEPELARAWIGFVLSAEGRGALARAGFSPLEGERPPP